MPLCLTYICLYSIGKWDNPAASEGNLNSGMDVGHVASFCCNIKRLKIQVF